jgi:SecD/SecF fusion protein
MLIAQLTKTHLPDTSTDNRFRLGIILDGELYSAPQIYSPISDRGIITSGSYSKEEVSDMAAALTSGSLLVRLRQIPGK